MVLNSLHDFSFLYVIECMALNWSYSAIHSHSHKKDDAACSNTTYIFAFVFLILNTKKEQVAHLTMLKNPLRSTVLIRQSSIIWLFSAVPPPHNSSSESASHWHGGEAVLV